MKHSGWKRFETGLLLAVLVLFLYAPAQEPQKEEPVLRFRTAELVQDFAEWLGLWDRA